MADIIDQTSDEEVLDLLRKTTTEELGGKEGDTLTKRVGKIIPSVLAFGGIGGVGRAPFAKAVTGGAAAAATEGFFRPVAEEDSDLGTRAERAAVGGAVGAGVGAALQPIANVLGTGVRKFFKVTPQKVKMFEEAGVDPTLANISSLPGNRGFREIVSFSPGVAKVVQTQIDDQVKQLGGAIKRVERAPLLTKIEIKVMN